ncbi:MAG: hypothetical protein JF630_13645 [Geodermatophilales bacterium]|nr:hypothetical protein [Geodermatophilales bacterium]
MTDGTTRTGAPRDVPPPRPITPQPAYSPADGSGLGRAARAVADAVAGLVGGAGTRPDAAGGARTPTAGLGLRDLVGAVAGAVGSAFGAGSTAAAPPPVSEQTPGAERPRAALGDLLAAAAPGLPIRNAGRLRQAYPGASDDEIADALVARAARLTGGIGAAAGGFSAARRFAPLSLLTLPLELGAETALIAGVEVVLVGELHELYGRPAPGDARARATAYLNTWSSRRPDEGAGAAGLGAILGAGARALRRRATRVVPAAAPFVLGAAVAGQGNRRATELLAERLLADLRGPGRQKPGDRG